MKNLNNIQMEMTIVMSTYPKDLNLIKANKNKNCNLRKSNQMVRPPKVLKSNIAYLE